MESRRQQKRIPLGCRFVPYDQWFMTHIEPTWKIKHVKQMILAKCFGLPFDPRKFIRDNTSARAPSPITFAPDESTRPVSPIQFATPQEVRKKRSAGGPGEGGELVSAPNPHVGVADGAKDDDGDRGGGDEGYEEDDEWDDDDDAQFPRTSPLKLVIGGRVDMGGKVELATSIAPLGGIASPIAEKPSRKFNPLSKLTGSSGNTSSSNHNSSNTSSTNPSSGMSQSSDFVVVDQKEPKKDLEIHTHNYTLIRFSTGQILEEDFLVSWYDLVPNELVELHASSTPVSFEVTLTIPQLLLDPSYRSSTATLTNDRSSRTQSVATDTTFFSTGITLTSLPRHDPVAYAEPYWEGWVRALRVVWQSEMPSAASGGGKGHSSYQEYAAGMTNFQNSMAGGLAVFVSEPGLFPEKQHHGGSRMKKKLEWRERWVVIRDGTINLCKTRYDLNPTHCLPLATLLSLRDASHLINTGQSKSKPSSTTRPRSKTLKSGDPDRDRRSHRRSISQPRSSTSTAKDHRHRDDGRNGRTEPARGLTVDSPRRGERSSQDPAGQFTAPMSAAELAHRRAEADQHHRDRQRAREQRQKQEMELEYLKNWDDVRISFKRKTKDKGKEKERGDKGKGRDLDYDKDTERSYKSKRADPESSAYKLEREQTRSHKGYTEHEKERERERGKEKEKERDSERDRQRRLKDLQKPERDRSGENWWWNERTFIPHTREEAEAAGMKIICAKFKSLRSCENERQPAGKTTRPGHRYTSTGPSLAGEAAYVNESDVTDNDRSRKDTKAAVGDDLSNNHQHTQSQTGLTLQTVAPRKASLPLIHLSSNKHSSQSLMLNSPAATTNALGINGSSSTTKFGITGLFSKDRVAAGGDNPSEDPNTAKKEKEEKKKEEKERKAREKEQKLLEKKAKDKEKTKRKDETGDEEEAMTANALSWKLGKKKSGKVKEEALADAGLLSDSAVASSSTTLNDAYTNAGRPKPLSINTAVDASGHSSSITVGEYIIDNSQSLKNSATREDGPMTPVMRARPKLTLSPIPDSATQAKAEQSDSNSSSCSLSSPVFYHSAGSDESLDEFDTDANGPLANTRRAERKGYRYGGYHDRKQEGKRKVKSDAGHGPRPSVFGVFDTPELHKPSEKGKEREKSGNLSSAHPPESRSHSHSHDRKDDKKRKEDDHGDWIVLDMGSDHAFNSILRIFHRYFSQPLTSNFVPASMAAVATAAHAQSSADVPQSPTSIYPTQSLKSESNVNSPVLSHFWSSTTLARGSDDASIVSDRSGLGSANVASSSNLRSVYNSAATPEHEDEDDIYADFPKVPTSQPSRESLNHPTTLKTASQPQKRSSIVPALPYPEWRRELVLRARRHGMRDASRPLDLALNGWGRDFDEMDLESVAFRLQRRKEEEQRRNIRNSYISPDIYGYGDQMYRDGFSEMEDDGVDGDVEHEHVEEEIVPVVKPGRDDGRRMSQVSHVSTIKAAEINAAAAASIRSNQSILESAGTFDENDEGGSDGEEQWEDAESVVGYKDDEYEPKYGYGQEDEVEAIALGMDSMLEDSEEEEESETEWTAWLTDLPRQIEARKEQKNLEARRREEEEEIKQQEVLHKQGFKPGEKPLSPMIFSNPFTEQQQAPPLEVDDLSLGDAHFVPKTQEEERRQYLASRIKLEPTIMMTTTNGLPPAPSADHLQVPVESVHQHGVSVASISSVLGSEVNVDTRSYVGGQQTHPNRFTSRTVSALSSQSSSESLGNARPITSEKFSLPSNEPHHLLPLSPVGSESLDDDADRDRYTASSSTTPPSASYLVTENYTPQTHRRSHSRSVSGSDVGQPKLHHSLSMPLGPGSPPLVRGHGSSVPSSPPHSPTIPSTLTKTIMKKTVQPVSMPILTQAQINEIESETAERMRQQHPAAGFQPNAMSSSSSSFIPKSIPIPMPRRSSSAGYSGSGSPPSSAGAALNLSTSLGSAGGSVGGGGGGGSPSIGRSASLLVKPNHAASGVLNERGERERGVLKKKPSDLGKEREREGDLSPGKGKQRPKLSLAGLGGGSSSAVSSSSVVPATANQYNTNIPEVHSPTGGSTMKAFLRRVRSGSSLRLDRHAEEDDAGFVNADPHSPPVPSSPTIATREGREVSPPPGRRRIGPMDRFVRGLDSALEFVEGR